MPRRIQKGGSRGNLYREAGRQRLQDAAVLLKEARYTAAVYLAGYAIECQLKFAVCQHIGITHLPEEFETHDWDQLVQAAGLGPGITAQKLIRNSYSGLTQAWGPWLRYQPQNHARKRAESLYKDFTDLYEFLNELAP